MGQDERGKNVGTTPSVSANRKDAENGNVTAAYLLRVQGGKGTSDVLKVSHETVP